jgi:hypothetical protein
MGRWLLTELERASLARHAQHAAVPPAAASSAGSSGGVLGALQQAQPSQYGAFVLCTPLSERSCFIVVTTRVRGAWVGCTKWQLLCVE